MNRDGGPASIQRGPRRLVPKSDVNSAVAALVLILVLIVLQNYAFVPGAFGTGLAVGPAAMYVKNRRIDDEFRENAFILLVVGLIALIAVAGLLDAMFWLLVGFNVGTLAVAAAERY